VTHSHLSIRHLLPQIDSDRSRRPNRDIRPEWLTELIEFAAERFEPVAEVARVGFECQLNEEGWHVSLYLGMVECVGGKEDGTAWRPDFRFDLHPLLARFTAVNGLAWIVFPNGDGTANSTQRCTINIEGFVGENHIRLTVHSESPDHVGPGLRKLPDGRFEPV